MIQNSLLKSAERYARERLSDKRHGHTLRVAEAAERLAEVHGLDRKKLRLAALLHDSSREVGAEELLRLAQERGVPVGPSERESPKLARAVSLSCRGRTSGGELGGPGAVRAHTTGAPLMIACRCALFLAARRNRRGSPGREYCVPGREGPKSAAGPAGAFDLPNEERAPHAPDT